MPPTEELKRERRVERESLTGEEKILFALEGLTNEVLFVRKMIDPISRRQRILIIAWSSFMGGVVTNLVLWLLGLGTMYGLSGLGGHHP
jgi:hypothetical protein